MTSSNPSPIASVSKGGTGFTQPTLAEIQELATVLQALKALKPNSRSSDDERPRVNDAEWAQHVVDALLKRLTRRVPLPANTKLERPAEHCPFTGLNHSQIYEAMEPHEDGRPTIRSISLAEPGEASGAKFYSVQSAIDYMEYLAHRPAAKTQGGKTSV